MNISEECRNEAYANITNLLPNKNSEILKLFKKHQPCTMQHICAKENFSVNQVSGRVTELKQACLLKEIGKIPNYKTKQKNTIYTLTTVEERKELAAKEILRLEKDKEVLLSQVQIGIKGVVAEVVSKSLKNVVGRLNTIKKLKIA